MGNHAPKNGRGDMPFLKKLDGTDWKDSIVYAAGTQSPDYATPNEAYWQYMDELIASCERHGILVFFFPSYVGYHDSDQGWIEEMTANGPQKIKAYGAWIAARYRNAKNIVWMLLGDDGRLDGEKRLAEAALIGGLKSVPGQQSVNYSAESYSGENAADNEDFGKEMTLNGIYNWVSHLAAQSRKAYARDPVMPAFLLEEPYDEEGPDGNGYNPHATQPVRRFCWWAWLSSVAGYVAGNGYVWPFAADWERHLDSRGAKDLSRLNAFVRSIPWWTLIPSGQRGTKEILTEGQAPDTTESYVAAAASSSGDLLVAYIPPEHRGSIAVDLGALKGSSTASWFDPASGRVTVISGISLGSRGVRRFTPPPVNGSGDHDWVLVVRRLRP